MRCSIVTISFNQVEFLEKTLLSVIEQKKSFSDIEYIVVDAGSTDGSRELIQRYAENIDHIVFESDSGPANGLNKGFALATGDIFAFLNSDDVLYSGAIKALSDKLQLEHLDVVSGDALLIDQEGQQLRKLYSDAFDLNAAAYGASILIQPSTIFSAQLFKEVGGFNEENKSNWDGELFIDFALKGAKFGNCDFIASGYRLHEQSITGTKKIDEQIKAYQFNIFQKIKQRDWSAIDSILGAVYSLKRKLFNYKDTLERITKGKSYGRMS